VQQADSKLTAAAMHAAVEEPVFPFGHWFFSGRFAQPRHEIRRAAVERKLTAVICNRNNGVDTESVIER
jgi:hypothetical protein